VDYVLAGEYELALPELLKSDERGSGFDKIQGLYYRHNGEIRQTFPPTFNVPFDSLPYPDRDDLPVKNYHNFEVAGKPTVQMLTSRGCPFQCSFCNSTVYWPGGAYWPRSIPKVVDEMEFVKKKYKAKQIWFDDDISYTNPERIRSLAEEIMSRKLDLPWAFMGAINLDEESLRIVSKAGAVGVAFGVESVNPDTLKRIHKSWVTPEKTRNFVKTAKKYGLWVHGDFMVGLPFDTRESILAALEFAVDLDLDSAQYYAAQPLPGTPFFWQAKENGWLLPDYMDHYDGNYDTPVNYPWLSKDQILELLVICKRRVEKEQLKHFARSPRRMWRYVRGRGLSYAIRKAKTIISSKDHVYVAGT
ncbi:B12-binding domain-containing radical SAM protein, partial [Candidatus Bathyarchaeota archaeon]|nr:B12-binding domain-containing radical SAM protein [Candidatus Bathyarchaeota archaeon]